MNERISEKAKKTFSLFAPYIKDYIYKEGWDNLRQIQIEAAEGVFFTEHDLVISAGTASGKTEAALFPILSLMEKEKSDDFQVLYISPVKALINDQFERTGNILKESGVPVYRFHGDVAKNQKESFFKTPKGFIQITPESLESLLLRHWEKIPVYFSNLRFVIIDEIHALMGTDRGLQILAILERMETVLKTRPRRIGLSATVANLDKAAFWLNQNKNETTKVAFSQENTPLRLGLDYFTDDNEADEWIYRATKGQKSIVFSNSREETEKITANLTKIAETKKEKNRFYIHHGNLSLTLRKEAEEKLQSDEKEVTVFATSTLEFGIDIEKLKRVICQESPLSVSSFLQRLGRSGRRESPPEMLMAFREKKGDHLSLLDQFPWELIQAIAIIELYRKEKWIEETENKNLPFSLLFHQIICILGAEGPKSTAFLAKRILSLSPFKQVSKEDFKRLIIFLIEKGYLELCEKNVLMLGTKSEALLAHHRFLSVFQSKDDFSVFYKNERIGVTSTAPAKGKSFTLGGKIWEVEETDFLHKVIFVRPGKETSDSVFLGSSLRIHTKICEKMGEILLSNQTYPYLFPNAITALENARNTAKEFSMTDGFISLGHGAYALIPFCGGKIFESIKQIFEKQIAPTCSLTNLRSHSYHFLTFCSKIPKETLYQNIKTILNSLSESDPLFCGDPPMLDKYDTFLPKDLLLKSFLENHFDQKGALAKLNEIFQ